MLCVTPSRHGRPQARVKAIAQRDDDIGRMSKVNVMPLRGPVL